MKYTEYNLLNLTTFYRLKKKRIEVVTSPNEGKAIGDMDWEVSHRLQDFLNGNSAQVCKMNIGLALLKTVDTLVIVKTSLLTWCISRYA